VIGRADANDWFKVKTQQGVEGYVWMFLSDHQSAVSVRRLRVVTENSVRAGNAKILSACRHSQPEKLIEGTIQ